jgi:hypothetical protein
MGWPAETCVFELSDDEDVGVGAAPSSLPQNSVAATGGHPLTVRCR